MIFLRWQFLEGENAKANIIEVVVVFLAMSAFGNGNHVG